MPFNNVNEGERFEYIGFDWIKISDTKAYCLTLLVDTSLAPGDKVHLSGHREYRN